jgi:hypothetical protein
VSPLGRKVIPFTAKPTADDLPVPVAHLQAAVLQFDELRRYAERLAVSPQWSAMEWRAVCSPVLIRLPRARQSLAILDPVRVGRHADTRWAARVRTARSEVERRLTDIRISMSAVTSMEISSRDAVVTMSSDGALLAAALGDLRALIVCRYPAVAGDGTDR